MFIECIQSEILFISCSLFFIIIGNSWYKIVWIRSFLMIFEPLFVINCIPSTWSLTEIFAELYALGTPFQVETSFSQSVFSLDLCHAIILSEILLIFVHYIFCRPEILEVVKNHTHLVISIPPAKGLGDPVCLILRICFREYLYGAMYMDGYVLFPLLSQLLIGTTICRCFVIDN